MSSTPEFEALFWLNKWIALEIGVGELRRELRDLGLSETYCDSLINARKAKRTANAARRAKP